LINMDLGFIKAYFLRYAVYGALPMGGEIAPSLEVDGSLSYTMSGGPLFSEAGQLLGMNSLMPRGKGMTLPIQQLQSLAQSIKIRGNPKMGYLGIATTPAQGGGGQRTLVITEIEKGSPASEAGLLVGIRS
jgi:S1-C subfamily serine protease